MKINAMMIREKNEKTYLYIQSTIGFRTSITKMEMSEHEIAFMIGMSGLKNSVEINRLNEWTPTNFFVNEKHLPIRNLKYESDLQMNEAMPSAREGERI